MLITLQGYITLRTIPSSGQPGNKYDLKPWVFTRDKSGVLTFCMAIFFFVCRDRAQFQEEGKSGCREKFKTNLFWVWSTPVLKTIWAPLRGNTDLQKQNRAQKSYCSISLTNKKGQMKCKSRLSLVFTNLRAPDWIPVIFSFFSQ